MMTTQLLSPEAEVLRVETGTPEGIAAPDRRWRPRSVALIVLCWLVLQIGGMFSPGLLDDVDSVYIEIAREMLHRHDYVTPYINGTRFFDKPPLMYWMAAGSMQVFGEYDWAARLPLALAVLGFFFAVYALGKRFFGERGGLYAALAAATSVGPYLYTRFFIPDILIALWMTLGVHLLLMALDRASVGRSARWPALGFAAVLGLNLMTKGLIGLVFPLGFVVLYLTLTRQWAALKRMHLLESIAVFVAVALPWHVMAALRNPAIPLPAGVGLPAHGGWAWFYLYNEHFARFVGKRIPHDYGNTPVWLFWMYAAIWTMPWTAFLPGAIANARRALGHRFHVTVREREAALALVLWALLVMGFFTVSHRQEYYSLPGIPALTLMAGGLLARSERNEDARRSALRWTIGLLIPLTTAVAAVCGYFAIAAPRPAPGTDLATLLAANPELYNVSLGHIFDLTGAAMGLFRAPLVGVTVAMLVLGWGSYLLRRTGRGFAANLTLAGGMLLALTCAHEGLARFYPTLGSKELALVIAQTKQPDDLIALDGELTSGSTLVFYTRQQVHLINGDVNGLWYGSFWPDAPKVFETEDSLRSLWRGDRRVFLLTYDAAKREQELQALGPMKVLAAAGGKTVLSNR